jgi:hypothetical protein
MKRGSEESISQRERSFPTGGGPIRGNYIQYHIPKGEPSTVRGRLNENLRNTTPRESLSHKGETDTEFKNHIPKGESFPPSKGETDTEFKNHIPKGESFPPRGDRYGI